MLLALLRNPSTSLPGPRWTSPDLDAERILLTTCSAVGTRMGMETEGIESESSDEEDVIGPAGAAHLSPTLTWRSVADDPPPAGVVVLVAWARGGPHWVTAGEWKKPTKRDRENELFFGDKLWVHRSGVSQNPPDWWMPIPPHPRAK